MMGAGSYQVDDESNLGMLGVLGNYWTNQAISEADVLLVVGSRLTDRINNAVKNCAKNGKIIYVDIAPSEFSEHIGITDEIVCDAHEFLTKINAEFDNGGYAVKDNSQWIEKISQWKSMRTIPTVSTGKMMSHTVLEKICEFTKEYNPIVATEVGQHQLWTLQAFNFTQPRKLLTSGGLGTMGFGFPAAMGACFADKDALVLDISGDGSIQMNIQELATCVEYKLPVKVMILNNGYLGMVRQWQEKFYDGHYCGTEITSPDFVKVAEAYGAKGIRVEKEEDIESAIKDAIAYDGPVFIDFIVEPLEFVYPYLAK
jgi:acetolactate synthase-1/2/3 large subunit